MDYNNYGDNKLAARQAAEYIRFNSYVNDRINRAYSLIGGGIKRICGIKLRGSDYITSRPPAMQFLLRLRKHIAR